MPQPTETSSPLLPRSRRRPPSAEAHEAEAASLIVLAYSPRFLRIFGAAAVTEKLIEAAQHQEAALAIRGIVRAR